MSEANWTCRHCQRENSPSFRFCEGCGRSVVSGGRSYFGVTALVVAGLWLATAVVVAIVQFATVDPSSSYGPDFGIVVVTGMTYIFYGFFGVAIGLIMLIFNRSIGGGILAGTGLGLVTGFVACLALTGIAGG